jgi:hypothetical protein
LQSIGQGGQWQSGTEQATTSVSHTGQDKAVPPRSAYIACLLIVPTLVVANASILAAQTSRVPEVEEERDSTDGANLEGTLRAGAEYDTNAFRGLTEQDRTAGLGRYFLTLEGEFEPYRKSTLDLRLRQGGKWYPAAGSADALLTSLDARWRQRLSDTFGLRFQANFKDRLERTSRQDYSRGGARTALQADFGDVDARLGAGWRYFAFRPNPASSSHGPHMSASVGVQVSDPIRLNAYYDLSRRIFDSVRFVLDPDGDVVQRDPSGQERRDWLHVLRLGGTYRGPLILEAAYVLLMNRSNSYGQGLVRHGAELDVTAPLPWRLYLSGRLRLQWTRYEDPIFVGADFQVDEENRNALTLSVARAIGDHWEVEARYRLFIEEFGTTGDYRRQTVFLGGAYLF